MKLITGTRLLIAGVAAAALIAIFLPSKSKPTNNVGSNSTPITEVVKPVLGPAVPSAALKSVKRTVEKISVSPEQILFLNTQVEYNSVELLITEIQTRSKLYDNLYLVLDSPGGSVFDGSRLISYMESSKANIHTIVYGMCASMCFQIFEHGKTRYMVDRSVIMAHQASGGVRGNIKGMKNLLNFIDREVQKLDAYVADRAGMDRKTFDDLVTTDLWLAADDAIDLKLADKLAVIELPAASPEMFDIAEELLKRNIKTEDTKTKNPLVEIY